MKCIQCGHAMTTKRENVPYASLPGTVLVGVEVSRCPNCGEEEIAIPAIEALNRALANAVIRKPARLTGDEAKFLRKYLGYDGASFAKVIGANASSVSRWESGKQQLGLQTDLLLRSLVMLDKKVEAYPIEKFGEVEDRVDKPHYAFKNSKQSWKPTKTQLAA